MNVAGKRELINYYCLKDFTYGFMLFGNDSGSANIEPGCGNKYNVQNIKSDNY